MTDALLVRGETAVQPSWLLDSSLREQTFQTHGIKSKCSCLTSSMSATKIVLVRDPVLKSLQGLPAYEERTESWGERQCAPQEGHRRGA